MPDTAIPSAIAVYFFEEELNYGECCRKFIDFTNVHNPNGLQNVQFLLQIGFVYHYSPEEVYYTPIYLQRRKSVCFAAVNWYIARLK